jgi:hypothetical protein
LKGGETQPQPPTADGRDPATGRFIKGVWKGGAGNPFFRRLAQLRAQAVCEITPDEVRALMRKLYCSAMEGDIAASVVLLGYLLGKPAKVVDPDAVDEDQWPRMRDVPSQKEFACANITASTPWPPSASCRSSANSKIRSTRSIGPMPSTSSMGWKHSGRGGNERAGLQQPHPSGLPLPERLRDSKGPCLLLV